MANVYATWNPADKGANVVLTNGNLTATKNNSAWQNVRSTIGVSSGKWYWELTVVAMPTNEIGAAIANIGDSLTTEFGDSLSNNSMAYLSTSGAFNFQQSRAGYGATYTVGDVIGVALDVDTGTLKFYKNNSL